MAMKRVFIAVPLSEAAIQSLQQTQNQLQTIQSVRWIKPAHMHLTLQFLGSVPQTELPKLMSALNQSVLDHRPFKVQIAALGVFPNLRRPQVIWAGLSGNLNNLHNLHAAIIETTASLGFTPEARSYKPHLTLGRVKKHAKANDYTQISRSIKQIQDSVGHITTLPVDRITLFQSQLQPTGPIYTPLLEIRLGKS